MDGNAPKVARNSSKIVCLLCTLSYLFLGLQCKESKDSEFVLMTFIIPVSIHPQTVELQTGDTLWLSGSFPDTLLELHSNKYYKIPDFDFKSKMCLTRLVDPNLYLSQQPPAVDQFSVVSVTGSFTRVGSLCGDFNFMFTQNKYNYKIGVVPKTSGEYNLNFLWPIDLHNLPEEQIDLRSVIDLGATADGRERIPIYEAFYFVINEGNTNFEVFKNSYRAASIEEPTELNVYTEQKGSFAFRVVE
jgi:hypothetical protein